MLIRKIVLQPINLANAPKRSTDKIGPGEGASATVRGSSGVCELRGSRGRRRRGGQAIALHCMPHAVGNFIMRLSVSSDQESASGQAGVAATAAAAAAAGGAVTAAAGGGGSPRVSRIYCGSSAATRSKSIKRNKRQKHKQFQLKCQRSPLFDHSPFPSLTCPSPLVVVNGARAHTLQVRFHAAAT